MCERLCEGCDSPHSSKYNSILVHRTPQWPGDSQKPEQHAWEETPQIYNRPSLPKRTNQSRKLLGNCLGIHMEVSGLCQSSYKHTWPRRAWVSSGGTHGANLWGSLSGRLIQSAAHTSGFSKCLRGSAHQQDGKKTEEERQYLSCLGALSEILAVFGSAVGGGSTFASSV